MEPQSGSIRTPVVFKPRGHGSCLIWRPRAEPSARENEETRSHGTNPARLAWPSCPAAARPDHQRRRPGGAADPAACRCL